MVRKSIIFSLVYIALCCGCGSRDIEAESAERNEVLLSINETKRESETTLENLKAQGFRTFLYKNGNEKIRDEIVTWSNGFFRFAKETLWPGDGESLSVYAFASPEASLNLEESDQNPAIQFFLDGRLWYNNFDICVARVEDISGGGTINLPFKHILAKISGIYVKSLCKDPIRLWFHYVQFYEPARPYYDIRKGLWTNTKLTKELKIEAPIKRWGNEYKPVEDNMKAMYLVPGKKTIQVFYNILYPKPQKPGIHVKKISFDVLPGNDYILQLSIDEEHVSVSCISSDVQEWDSGEEISGAGL